MSPGWPDWNPDVKRTFAVKVLFVPAFCAYSLASMRARKTDIRAKLWAQRSYTLGGDDASDERT